MSYRAKLGDGGFESTPINRYKRGFWLHKKGWTENCCNFNCLWHDIYKNLHASCSF